MNFVKNKKKRIKIIAKLNDIKKEYDMILTNLPYEKAKESGSLRWSQDYSDYKYWENKKLKKLKNEYNRLNEKLPINFRLEDLNVNSEI